MSITILDFVGITGRINNTKFISYLNGISKEKFIASMSHPVLVSRKLYEGQLQKGHSKNTMVFSVKEIRETMRRQEQQQSPEDTFQGLNDDENLINLFMHSEKSGFYVSRNVFTIGRVIPNDLIIPDFTISKKHAATSRR